MVHILYEVGLRSQSSQKKKGLDFFTEMSVLQDLQEGHGWISTNFFPGRIS